MRIELLLLHTKGELIFSSFGISERKKGRRQFMQFQRLPSYQVKHELFILRVALQTLLSILITFSMGRLLLYAAHPLRWLDLIFPFAREFYSQSVKRIDFLSVNPSADTMTWWTHYFNGPVLDLMFAPSLTSTRLSLR